MAKSSSLNTFYKTLNDMIFGCNYIDCVERSWCPICKYKFYPPSWGFHKKRSEHRGELRSMAEQLMNAFLKLGIVIKATEGKIDADIYCVLCDGEHVGEFFNSSFRFHIDGMDHQFGMTQQIINKDRYLFAGELTLGQLDEFFKRIPIAEDEATLVRGVSRAAIIVKEDGSFFCGLCNFKLFTGRQEELISHIVGATHLAAVNDQLLNVVKTLGFDRGIIVNKNGSYNCTICDCDLGNVPETSTVYEHIHLYFPSAARHIQNESVHFLRYEEYKATFYYSIADCLGMAQVVLIPLALVAVILVIIIIILIYVSPF